MTIEELFSIQIEKPDTDFLKQAKEKWNRIAKPLDSLGDFEEMICRIAALQKSLSPDLSSKGLVIMCADNGIVAEGVSQSGQEVTGMVASMMGEGKSSVGILTKHYPLQILTIDVGMAGEKTPVGVIDNKICRGTDSFLKGPAMRQEQCLSAIETGIQAVADCKQKGMKILATGEMGIGNTTTSTAVLCALCGIDPATCTGRGAGLSKEGLQNKIRVIREGIRLHVGEPKEDGSYAPITDPQIVLSVLSQLGGLDIAALAGVFIGGAIHQIPIVIDGLISATAALVAERLVPGCKACMLASHRGREQGMDKIMRELSLKPVIHADMALGEGTGAVMLFPLLDMVLSLYTDGTTFQSASIEQYERQDV